MISQAKRILKGALRNIQKKAGLHIYRPVGNAQKWADWLTAAGVPNAKTADQLRVTIMTAMTDVQVIPAGEAYVVRSTSGVFCRIGDKLCFAWYDYGYYDRHWAIRELTGCEVCVHSRAVLVLSDDPGDFQFTDEQLERAPASLVLDGEATEALESDTTDIVKSADIFKADAATVEKAKAALRASFDDADADPMQQAALEDLANSRAVSKAALVEDLGPDLAADLGLAGRSSPAPAPKPAPVADKAKTEDAPTVRKIKSDEDRQIIYVWASVSSRDGDEVVDFHGDTISNNALHDICTHVVKGARSSAFEHDGDFVNEVVSAFVLDKDMQKALSAFSTNGDIALDREGVIVGIHVPDKEHWAEVKDQDWEASINATAFIEAIEEKEAA